MTAIILFTAAGIAAPLLVAMAVVVLIPWLLWGFSFTKRLHDRDKSAWWLMVFYLVPGVLGQLGCMVWRGRRHGDPLRSGAGGFSR